MFDHATLQWYENRRWVGHVISSELFWYLLSKLESCSLCLVWAANLKTCILLCIRMDPKSYEAQGMDVKRCRCNLQLWMSIWDTLSHWHLIGHYFLIAQRRAKGTFSLLPKAWLNVGLQAPPGIWGILALPWPDGWSTSPKKCLDCLCLLSQKPPEAGQPRFENVDLL